MNKEDRALYTKINDSVNGLTLELAKIKMVIDSEIGDNSGPGNLSRVINDLSKKVEKTIVILNGNGDPSRGLTVKVDRNTEFNKNVKWGLGIGFTFLIGIILKFVFHGH
tara:strand:+ start:332 stop:658 length:327 start_codon:yes stop_codon:yes gene_type:complete